MSVLNHPVLLTPPTPSTSVSQHRTSPPPKKTWPPLRRDLLPFYSPTKTYSTCTDSPPPHLCLAPLLVLPKRLLLSPWSEKPGITSLLSNPTVLHFLSFGSWLSSLMSCQPLEVSSFEFHFFLLSDKSILNKYCLKKERMKEWLE